MVVAEVLTGLALLNKSVDFIKTNINTAKDISSFAQSITDILDAEDQIQKSRSKKAGVGGLSHQLGLSQVASSVIDAKLAAEKRYEMRVLVDMRFGSGTWKSIVDERARRIQEAKEEAKRLKKEQDARNQEIIEIAMVVAVVTVAAIALFGLVYIFTRP